MLYAFRVLLVRPPAGYVRVCSIVGVGEREREKENGDRGREGVTGEEGTRKRERNEIYARRRRRWRRDVLLTLLDVAVVVVIVVVVVDN